MMPWIKCVAYSTKDFVNNLCKDREPWQVIAATAGTVLFVRGVVDLLDHNEGVLVRTKKCFFRLVRRIPAVQKKIDEEMAKTTTELQAELDKHIGGATFVTRLPQTGWTEERVLEEVDKYGQMGQFKWKEGSSSGTVYHGGDDLTELTCKVYRKQAWANPLHFEVFPGVRKMEAEVVRMAADLFHGAEESCGTMTSGGTESIMLAVKAYRDYARETRGLRRTEVVMPSTAHPAFQKAAHFFDMRVTTVAVDPDTLRVRAADMRRAISKYTCMLVVSCPGFPHGVIDPVEEVAQLGLQYNIPVHVDACLGGFLVVFMEDAGFEMPPFDFRVPGVTSISADTHKYAFTPKGSSLILYSKPDYCHHQFFVQTDWAGGMYASPSFAGSRSGALIAMTWATLMYYGHDGYVGFCKKIINTTRYIETSLRKIPGIHVIGEPGVSVVAIGSHDFNIYNLSDALVSRGWNLCALQSPPGIHIAVTHIHTQEGVADRLIADVREVAAELLKNPPTKDSDTAVLYGMAASIPDRSILSEVAWSILDSLYSTNNARSRISHKSRK